MPDFAGSTWVRLQYILGLQRLGVDCYWIDQLKPVDPLIHHHSLEYITSRFANLAEQFGFSDRYCIVYNEGESHFGMSKTQLEQLASEADLLLNISGHMKPESPLMRIPRRAYVDVDPGFTQIWGAELLHLERHNLFFTTGQNVGTERFRIATGAFDWIPFLPPVALEAWPANIDDRCTRISTVADWHASQGAWYAGELYGGKQDEFFRFMEVPKLADKQIELALTIHQTEYRDQGTLLDNGWLIRDPYFFAGDVHSYREFIKYSRAEFSVAKGGYVKSNSGWISDRTACYLASGKPAIVQSTGFEDSLPEGLGLVSFTTIEEAVAALATVDNDYLKHCAAAREIAERYFSAEVVLSRLLAAAGLS
ncbi:MAG TPA: hypothetical protein VM099_16800 [Gemmatimonadaceae bacterium]|nr:hypothetical protein [Gemmatimonadaceae bacterium]